LRSLARFIATLPFLRAFFTCLGVDTEESTCSFTTARVRAMMAIRSAANMSPIILKLDVPTLSDVKIKGLKHHDYQTMHIRKGNSKCTALHDHVETRSTAWVYNRQHGDTLVTRSKPPPFFIIIVFIIIVIVIIIIISINMITIIIIIITVARKHVQQNTVFLVFLFRTCTLMSDVF